MQHLFPGGAPLALLLAVTAVFSYFCGCFNGAVIVSKYILRDDVRTHGSGNAGLTNFFRTFGGPLTLVVILCDVFKAVAALLVSGYVIGSGYTDFLSADVAAAYWHTFAKYWAGLFCLLGHMFPCMFRFKGGKGILSGGTIALMLDWRIALVVWGGFVLLAAATRYVSLGSILGSISFPIAVALINVAHGRPVRWEMLFSAVYALIIILKHSTNISRLIHGNENKISLRKPGSAGTQKPKDGSSR